MSCCTAPPQGRFGTVWPKQFSLVCLYFSALLIDIMCVFIAEYRGHTATIPCVVSSCDILSSACVDCCFDGNSCSFAFLCNHRVFRNTLSGNHLPLVSPWTLSSLGFLGFAHHALYVFSGSETNEFRPFARLLATSVVRLKFPVVWGEGRHY